MDSPKHSELNEEQLYMFEFLVDHVDPTPEANKLIENSSICVRLKFMDLPVINLNQEEFACTKNKKPSKKSKDSKLKSASVDFSMGKSCLFPQKPFDLIQAIRSKPLEVEIYKLPGKNTQEEILISRTQVLLSGCLCDQVMMSKNDSNHFPKPYVLKNTYNLVDNQGNPFGTITLFLKLSTCGKFIETQFALQEESFVFKNRQSPNEFQCSNFSEMKQIKSHSLSDKEQVLKPENVIGLMSLCRELPDVDIETRKELKEINSNGEIKINSEEVFTLEAEGKDARTEIKELFKKQNDNFKDDNCNLLSKVQSCSEIGCDMSLYLGANLFLENQFQGLNRSCNKVADFEDDRLRGGGCCTNKNASGSKAEKRTIGIIDHPIYASGSLKRDPYGNLSMETLAAGTCKSAWKNSATPNKIGCGCSGKGGGGLNSGVCSQAPCTGIDCFIRALKETQDFVDNLGKVPGLAGLGLMDPTESPYFGRQPEDADTCQPMSKKSYHHVQSANPKMPIDLSKNHDSYSKAKKLTVTKSKQILAPSTSYIATETQPFSLNRTYPDLMKIDKHNKNYQKSKKKDVRGKIQNMTSSKITQDVKTGESGPCGDSRCRSRRKKTEVDKRSSISSLKANPTKESSTGFLSSGKSMTNIKNDQKNKKRKRGSNRQISGPQHPLIKVSKNLMKQISDLRERNPGVVYGHKNCLDLRLRVPKNMGWLWNTRKVLGVPPPRIGWKPGAVDKYVYDLLKVAKEKSDELEEGEEQQPIPVNIKKVSMPRLTNFQAFGGRNRRLKTEDSPKEIELPPTLHIHRKDGTYYVTMYPINSQNDANPELQKTIKPLQFKVTKDKEDRNKDENGAFSDSSSSVSDMEIEFSPPAAISRISPKPETKNCSTQLKQQDILDAFKGNSIKSAKSVKIKK